MLRGQFLGISKTKMLNCLTRLSRDIKIVVGPQKDTSGKATSRSYQPKPTREPTHPQPVFVTPAPPPKSAPSHRWPPGHPERPQGEQNYTANRENKA